MPKIIQLLQDEKIWGRDFTARVYGSCKRHANDFLSKSYVRLVRARSNESEKPLPTSISKTRHLRKNMPSHTDYSIRSQQQKPLQIINQFHISNLNLHCAPPNPSHSPKLSQQISTIYENDFFGNKIGEIC